MIAGAGVNLLRVWDAASGTTLIDFAIGETHVFDVSWSPDNMRIVSGSHDQYVRVWNVADPNYAPGQLLTEFQPFPDGIDLVTAVAWSPDGQVIATGGLSENASLKIWDANTYILTNRFVEGWIEEIDWHPNSNENKLAIAGPNGGPSIASLVTPLTGQVTIIGGRNVPAGALAWNSDGSQIAVGYEDGSIYVWDSVTNALITMMPALDQNGITQLVWNSDDSRIAGAGGIHTRVWNSTTGQLIATIPDGGQSVAFSPDGSELAYGAADGVVQNIPAPGAETPTAFPTVRATQTSNES
jgi:WD40 repeat protein